MVMAVAVAIAVGRIIAGVADVITMAATVAVATVVAPEAWWSVPCWVSWRARP
jgi:hypothetical protein